MHMHIHVVVPPEHPITAVFVLHSRALDAAPLYHAIREEPPSSSTATPRTCSRRMRLNSARGSAGGPSGDSAEAHWLIAPTTAAAPPPLAPPLAPPPPPAER
eukprot:360380-Chlamydomonas_euryale.AAC.1